jgi:alkaline phosphatase D
MPRLLTLPCLGLLAIALATQVAPWAPAQQPAQQPANFPRQYKREHQDALKKILTGKEEQAIADLTALAERLPRDAETQYMLAVAHAKQGDEPQSLVHMKRALELRLPPGRLLSGWHTGLAVPFSPDLLGDPERWTTRPVHGPMLGQIDANSAFIWLRTAPSPQRVQAIARKVDPGQGDNPPVESTLVTASQENDWVVKISLTGLEPNTQYRYTLKFDNQPQSHEHWTFKTFAPRGQPVKFRFAFGGGAGYVPPNERAWTTIENENPDVLVLLGDNVYIDDPTTPAMQHYCYYRRQSRPEFRRLVAQTPVYTIWDDHDFATNDSQGGPAIDSPAWKRPVYKVYRDNWVNPAYGGDEHPGVYYDYYLGDVHFIMLDGRYYRDRKPADGSTPTMLGPVQKEWLKKTLKASEGKLIMLASPVPWVFEAKGDSPDTWNGFKQEREEIFGFMEENKIEGVVLISADRHRSDLWKIEREEGYPLYEFNSSRLTNQHVHGTMKEAIFSYNKKQSFGTVDIDTTAADPTVTYRVVTIDGEEVFRHTIRRSALE